MTREKLEEAYRLEQEAHRLRIQVAAETQRQQMQLEQAFEHRTGINLGVSDDYAVLDCGGLRFYYGYEYTVPPTVGDEDDDGEWAFVAWQNGNEVLRLPTSEVHPATREDPMFYLLAGIAHWLTTLQSRLEQQHWDAISRDQTIETLRAENARYREALEFYAAHGGERARAALGMGVTS